MAAATYASVKELLSEYTVERLVDSRQKFQRQVITIASDVSLAGKAGCDGGGGGGGGGFAFLV